MECFAVVIQKLGNRGLYNTVREHSIRLSAGSGQRPVFRGVWSAKPEVTTQAPREIGNV